MSGIDGSGEFRVKVEPARESVRVCAAGRLGAAGGVQLRREVDELVAVGFEAIVIDLRGLSSIEPSGVRILRAIANGAREHGLRLSLVPASWKPGFQEITPVTVAHPIEMNP